MSRSFFIAILFLVFVIHTTACQQFGEVGDPSIRPETEALLDVREPIASPLPKPIRLVYRPMPPRPYEEVFDSSKGWRSVIYGTFSAINIEGGNIEQVTSISRMSYGQHGRTFSFPMKLEIRVVTKPDGYPWIIKPLSVDLPQTSPIENFSHDDWNELRKKFIESVSNDFFLINRCSFSIRFGTIAIKTYHDFSFPNVDAWKRNYLNCMIAGLRGGLFSHNENASVLREELLSKSQEEIDNDFQEISDEKVDTWMYKLLGKLGSFAIN